MMNADKPEVFEYVDSNFAGFIVDKFCRLRENGLFLDVTLKAGAHKVHAHRVVLDAFSDYFAALFGTGMNESGQSEVTLHDVDGDSFIHIVDFAYSGRIAISADTVQKLLETANYLGVDQVKYGCCTFMADRMDVSNVLPLLTVADGLGLQSLVSTARCYAAHHFEQVCTTEEFLKLPPLLLRQLTVDNCLVFTENGFQVDISQQEKSILFAILRYFKHNPDSVHYLSEFLSEAIRLPLITRGVLESLKSNPLISASSAIQEVVDRALNWSDDSKPESWAAHRIHNGLKFYRSETLASAMMVTAPGTAAGTSFDDGTLAAADGCMYVTGMVIYLRRWSDGVNEGLVVGGLEVTYSTGDVVQHGNVPTAADGLREIHQFSLEDKERITGVKLRARWMIDQLTFTTSHQRSIGPFGGPGGSERKLTAPDQPSTYLAYLAGRVVDIEGDTCIRYVEFVFAYLAFTPCIAYT